MSGSCRMVDVAAAAAVSVSTVSNVLNAPHRVRPETLIRVRAIIDCLGYKRNEQAFLLRHGTHSNPVTAQVEATTKALTIHDEPSPALPETRDDPPPPARENHTLTEAPRWSHIPSGTHIHLATPGSTIIGGLVDECMTDGSALWVWLDHGQGRKLIHRSDDVTILAPGQDDD